jgi:hypothetical protein
MRQDGVLQASGMSTGARKISAGTIGNYSSDDLQNQTWNEEVAEILMYSRALSTSEIEQVEEYLSDRWGL